MSPEELLNFTTTALWLTVILSLPSVIVATSVGLLVALFQALTSIQEQTLPFGVKLFATIFVLYLTMRWIGAELFRFALDIFSNIHKLVI